MNRICTNCHYKNKCEYSCKTWNNCTLYPQEHCAKVFHEHCEEIATETFIKAIEELKTHNRNGITDGIIKQADIIINVANN
jgi:hypothetical protein